MGTTTANRRSINMIELLYRSGVVAWTSSFTVLGTAHFTNVSLERWAQIAVIIGAFGGLIIQGLALYLKHRKK